MSETKSKYPMDVSEGLPRLPQNMTELTAEWLSVALACSYPGVEVTSVHFGTVSHGTNTKIRLLLGARFYGIRPEHTGHRCAAKVRT